MPHVTGTKHHSSKMTPAKVRTARKWHDEGDSRGKKWSMSALAQKYGISYPSMRAIIRRDNWKHVT